MWWGIIPILWYTQLRGDSVQRLNEMSDEQQSDKVTHITRKGPMNAQQRKEAKLLFVASLRKDPNVSLACDKAGISRNTAYQWQEADEQFKKDWEDSIDRTKDVVRSAIYQRAAYGWDEVALSMNRVVYYYTPVLDDNGNQRFDSKGQPMMQRGDVVKIHKWDTALQLGWAKANLPEYKDEKTEINIFNEINNMAEQAKNDLLRDLASAADDDESQEEANQS
jgi:hypothetical protein